MMDLNALMELDRQLLLAVNGSSSLFMDGLVKTLTTATTWIPLYASLLYVVIKNNDSLKKVMLIVVCTALCVVLAGSVDDMLVKPLVARLRPTHDPLIGMSVDVVNGYRGGSFGFFSAHASNTFSIAIFFSLLIRNKILSVSLIGWSLVNCWTRMYLGVHFPGDILCGLLWGGVVGYFCWLIHCTVSRRLFSPNKYISTEYTATGYLVRDIDVIIAVLMLTFFYALLRACLFLYS